MKNIKNAAKVRWGNKRGGSRCEIIAYSLFINIDIRRNYKINAFINPKSRIPRAYYYDE